MRPLAAKQSREPRKAFHKSYLVAIAVYPVSFINVDWGRGSTEFSNDFSIPVKVMLKNFTFLTLSQKPEFFANFLRYKGAPQGLPITNSHGGLARFPSKYPPYVFWHYVFWQNF